MSAAMQLHRQIKMSASLTRDVKRQVAKHLFYSAADIAEPQDSQVMSNVMTNHLMCRNSFHCCSCMLTVLDNAH